MEKGKKIDMTACRDRLQDDLPRLFNSFFGEVLNILQIRFPHKRGDGSENESQFLCLRSKILRCGNDKLRDSLPKILNEYDVINRYDTVTTKTILVNTKTKVKGQKNG